MPEDQLVIFHIDMNFINLRKDYLLKWLKKISQMGYNAILWEVEDKIQWETCSECVWPEAMSKKEFKEVLAFSEELGLEAIPLLQTIGHAEYILKHEKYSSFKEDKEFHDCYCCLNHDVRKFLKSMISEYLDLFGENIRFFHLGGDEAYVFATCTKCRAYAKEYGENQLYADHIMDISEELFSNDIRPGIWSDMILHHPDQISKIPKKFLIWDWNYWCNDSYTSSTRIWGEGEIDKQSLNQNIIETIPEIIDENGDFVPFYTSDILKRLGFDVILCSSSRSGGDNIFCPCFNYHAMNIVGATRKVINENLYGTCVTSWGIRLNNFETQEILFKLVQATFSAPDETAQNIIKNAAFNMFKIDSTLLLESLSKLGTDMFFAREQTTGIQWNLLKDSLPAPQNYIADKIESMKNDSDIDWDELKEAHEKKLKDIVHGLNLLNKFIEKAETGFECLENWSVAGHLMLLQAKVVMQIFKEIPSEEYTTLASKLKNKAKFHFEQMETSSSAEKNASLVYDCLIEYLGRLSN